MKFLFDLGGVFFDWNPEYFYKDIFKSKNELNYFLSDVCNNKWNIKQDAGRPITKAIKELVSKFPKYKNEIELYYSNHRNMIGGVFENSIRVLESLKNKNVLCYVLSNWSAETFIGMVDDYPFLKKFDGIVLSGEEEIIKPDKRIYQIAIDRYDLIPSETVFIDDNLDNINTAIKLGFNTIHLIDTNEIKKEINKIFYKI